MPNRALSTGSVAVRGLSEDENRVHDAIRGMMDDIQSRLQAHETVGGRGRSITQR
jgi:hypothetical protein